MAEAAQGEAVVPGDRPATPTRRSWVANPCELCGTRSSRLLFLKPIADAPDGLCRIVACSSCGLRRLDPRPTDDDLSELYEDDYYAYAGRQRGRRKQQAWDWLRDVSSGAITPLLPLEALAKRVARWRFDVNVSLQDGRRPSVLDVGCGYGDLLLYFRDRGCQVMGIELDERAAKAASQLGVTVHARPLIEIGLKAGCVDVTVLQHSLEHLPHPAGTIAEIARVTRPGGEVHIAVPNGASAGLAHERDFWGALFCPEHFWYFDLTSLTQLLAQHGFVVTHAASKTIWINHCRLFHHLLTRDSPGLSPLARTVALTRTLRALAGTSRASRGDTLRVVARRISE